MGVGPVDSIGCSGTMTKPRGRRGMQEGSSPLIANWMPSTSMVVYTTRLPDSSVQLSCSISSTFCAELLATWNSESNFKDVNEVLLWQDMEI